ncbi:hypothetical protein BT69DRAFT_1277372 [Atractiella rhizophila]|nr:hypothetical protein BT69DRAFT_1277372 [Atractiella rhizophila]
MARNVVSRQRIQGNSLSCYEDLDYILEVLVGSNMRKDGWWNNGTENQFFGQSFERSWPTIFDCEDPTMLQRCSESDWLADIKIYHCTL